MKKQIKSLSLFGALLAVLHVTGCKHSDYIAPATGISVGTDQTHGQFLVDSKGVALYMFSDDVSGDSECTGGCLSIWPAAYIPTPTFSGVASTDFGEITRGDGKKQTTYRGFPLYYYSPTGNGKAEAAGSTQGDGIDNEWFVVKPNYTVMLASQHLVGHDGKNYSIAGVESDEETHYFVDGFGRTLYMFTNDTKNNNNFTAADLSNNGIWPVYDAAIADFPTGVNSADFGEITVTGTQKQLTYKGWPLYYFGGTSTVAGDTRGDTRGVSFPSPGIWHVVNTSTVPAPASVTVSDNSIGKIMTDAKGVTLYMFAKDTDGINHCTGGCANTWPPFYSDVVTVGDASLAAADFNVITRSDGAKQTTYKGWPLYYYSPTGDGKHEAAGTTAGDGIAGFWFASKSSYSMMVANGQLVGSDGKNYTNAYVEGTGSTSYFVDGNGRTVYHFKNDSNGKNTFTKSDFSNNNLWPIFHVDLKDVPSTLNKADFGEIDVFGQKQTTYKGWPLYYFGQDTNRNDTKGVSFPVPGGIWPVVFTTTDVAPQ